MIYFKTWNTYLLFKHCCYCFVWWTVYHWIFFRKVNRKYNHNTSCTLNNHRRPYRRTPVRQHLTESSKIITPKCHNHRRTPVRRHLTESSKIITPTSIQTTLSTSIPTDIRPSASYREFENNYTEMPHSPTSIPTETSPSTSHKEFENNYTEMPQSPTSIPTTLSTSIRQNVSVGKLSVGKFYRQKYWRNARIPKGVN